MTGQTGPLCAVLDGHRRRCHEI